MPSNIGVTKYQRALSYTDANNYSLFSKKSDLCRKNYLMYDENSNILKIHILDLRVQQCLHTTIYMINLYTDDIKKSKCLI